MASIPTRPAVLALSTVAVASVLSGVLVTLIDDPEPGTAPAATPAVRIIEEPAPEVAVERPAQVSRHANRIEARLDRPPVKRLREKVEDKAKSAPKKKAERPAPPAPRVNVEPGSNRALGYRLMIEFGFGADQWPALEALWTRESGWNHLADNPTSSAYGIPQALTGTHSMPAGYMTDPAVQIRWGLNYIKGRYGNPDGAWAHSQRTGWY